MARLMTRPPNPDPLHAASRAESFFLRVTDHAWMVIALGVLLVAELAD